MSFRNSCLVVLFVTIAPLAMAQTYGCPEPPFDRCSPYSYDKIYYSDASKTVVVGGWYEGCPNIYTCLNDSNTWGQQTEYFDLYCEPCEGCLNCQYMSKDNTKLKGNTCEARPERPLAFVDRPLQSPPKR